MNFHYYKVTWYCNGLYVVNSICSAYGHMSSLQHFHAFYDSESSDQIPWYKKV